MVKPYDSVVVTLLGCKHSINPSEVYDNTLIWCGCYHNTSGVIVTPYDSVVVMLEV